MTGTGGWEDHPPAHRASHYPGPQYPGPQYPGSQYPGSQYPGSQYPGSQYPGSQYPVPPYPVPPYPAGSWPPGAPGPPGPFGWPGQPQPWARQWYPAWPPPPKPPPHDVAQPFLHVMRSRTWHWWRPLLGLLLFVVVYGVAAIVGVVLVTLALLPTGTRWLLGISAEDLTDPRVLLITNVSLVVAIPAVWLVWLAVHQMRIGWSASVLGRLRWRLLLPWTGLALATMGVAIAASVGLGLAVGAPTTGPLPAFGWLVLVVLLTTPLQSAAEEYVFRGYLSQAVAAWFRSEATGALAAGLVSAALFSLAHGPQDVLTFLDRFAVGLAASAVVRLTGGLEAAICLHAVNNVLVFLLAGALGDGAATGNSGEGLGDFLLTVIALIAYVALVARFRRRLRTETRTAAQDLRPPPGPGWPPSPWGPGPGGPGPWGSAPGRGQPYGGGYRPGWGAPAGGGQASTWDSAWGLPGHGDFGAVRAPRDPSGIVSPWRREASHDPWGMG